VGSSGSRSRAHSRRNPRLLAGDEPTGNLDTVTAAEMFELLSPNPEGFNTPWLNTPFALTATRCFR
jgi:predicted ABC-type transport system involved in lysophospholipase L1 biosynthesis ATPase subunit